MPLLSELTQFLGKRSVASYFRGAAAGGGGGGLSVVGALFDWNAESITPQADDSDFTGLWVDDISGAEMQSGGSSIHPKYKDGSVEAPPSGVPFLDLDRWDVLFGQVSGIDTTPYSSWTVALVMRHDQVNSTSYVWRGNSLYPYIRTSGGGFIVYAGGDQNVFGNSRTGLWGVYLFSNNEGTLTLRSEGAEVVKSIGTSQKMAGEQLLGGTGSNNAAKAVARLSVWPRALDGTERVTAETELRSWAGLT